MTDYTEVRGDDGSAKLFYTFETESGKVFYLIIDRTENSEVVHFVTDVSENDLLNTTSDNSETLPKNSAALDSGRPVTIEPVQTEVTEENETEVETETGETTEPQEPDTEENPMGMYIVLGISGAGVIGGAYYLKVIKKKEDFIDEDDEEDNEEELEKEEDDSSDEFFNVQEGEEENHE